MSTRPRTIARRRAPLPAGGQAGAQHRGVHPLAARGRHRRAAPQPQHLTGARHARRSPAARSPRHAPNRASVRASHWVRASATISRRRASARRLLVEHRRRRRVSRRRASCSSSTGRTSGAPSATGGGVPVKASWASVSSTRPRSSSAARSSSCSGRSATWKRTSLSPAARATSRTAIDQVVRWQRHRSRSGAAWRASAGRCTPGSARHAPPARPTSRSRPAPRTSPRTPARSPRRSTRPLAHTSMVASHSFKRTFRTPRSRRVSGN